MIYFIVDVAIWLTRGNWTLKDKDADYPGQMMKSSNIKLCVLNYPMLVLCCRVVVAADSEP